MCDPECIRNPEARIETYWLCDHCHSSAPLAAGTVPLAFSLGKTSAARKKHAREQAGWQKANNAVVLMAKCLIARALRLPLPAAAGR